MKLLNSCTWEIRDFISDDVPPYGILSHTWKAGEEISYRDWQSLPSGEVESCTHGWQKIQYSCAQAVEDGLEWVWIDTCCIDQSSSAELSEAINSMFRWYQNAAVCWVFLSDVSKKSSPKALELELSKSRWFQRGWTLQELVAPRELVLLSKNWQVLGTKESLSSTLSRITTIKEVFLLGEPLESASVSKRMSWAANRQTTRSEDVAYSLLGIFDVNMPLLYGEGGSAAFRRLQLEISKLYPYDHTLYAWGVLVDHPSIPEVDDERALDLTAYPWSPDKVRPDLLGLLASSPKDFESAHSFTASPNAMWYYSEVGTLPLLPTAVGRGIRMDLSVVSLKMGVSHCSHSAITKTIFIREVVLICEDETRNIPLVHLRLYGWGDRRWGRTREIMAGSATTSYLALRQKNSCLYVEPEQRMRFQDGDIVGRQFRHDNVLWSMSFGGIEGKGRTIFVHENVHRGDAPDHQIWACSCRSLADKDGRGFSIYFGHTRREGSGERVVVLGFLPQTGPVPLPGVATHGIMWYNKYDYATQLRQHCDLVTTNKSGTWTVDVEMFPHVRVTLERIRLDEEDGGGIVDALDIRVTDREEYPWISRESIPWSASAGMYLPLNYPMHVMAETQKRMLRFRNEDEETISDRVSKRRRL